LKKSTKQELSAPENRKGVQGPNKKKKQPLKKPTIKRGGQLVGKTRFEMLGKNKLICPEKNLRGLLGVLRHNQTWEKSPFRALEMPGGVRFSGGREVVAGQKAVNVPRNPNIEMRMGGKGRKEGRPQIYVTSRKRRITANTSRGKKKEVFWVRPTCERGGKRGKKGVGGKSTPCPGVVS